MNRLLLIFALISSLLISDRQAQEKISVSPDFYIIQQHTAELVSKRWHRWCKTFTNSPVVPPLKNVELRMVRRADDLLTNIPLRLHKVNPLKDKPVYLIHAIAKSSFWKTTTEHLLVLQNVNNSWHLLLHFSGGWKGGGIDFKVVDLGALSRQEAILIQDHASGNQMSQTRSHIFRWDKSQNEFLEIFNELTTWLPSVIPVVYKSTLSFEKSNSTLKDVIIRTTFIRQQPENKRLKPIRTSVFKWNGKIYVGKMKKPEGVRD